MGIGISNNRLKRSLGVAQYMYEKIKQLEMNEACAREMFSLGFQYDIGYEFTDIKEDHPRVGGHILKDTGYLYWQEVYWHGHPNPGYSSFELDLLNEADLSVNLKGE